MRLEIESLSGSSLDHAIAYGKAGFKPVFIHVPKEGGGCSCRKTSCKSPGKHPILKKWQAIATSDEAAIREQYRDLELRDPNVGVVLGVQASSEYVIAIDVDEEARMLELLKEYGELPETLRGESGRGYRLFFSLDADVPKDRLRNIAGLGGSPGVDVKVTAGQVVVAPSIHHSGRKYTWTRGGDIVSLPPAWVLALLPEKIEPPKWIAKYTPQTIRADAKARKRAESYLETSVMDDARLLSSCPEGMRNKTLAIRAYALFSLCAGLYIGGSSWDYVRRELDAAGRASGLSAKEVRDVLTRAEKKVVDGGIVRVPVGLSSPSAPPPPPAAAHAPPVVDGNTAVALSQPNPLTNIQLEMDKGAPAKIAENVARLLMQHPVWNTGPALDNYSQMKIWPTPLPKPIATLTRRDREVVDADYSAIQGWLMSLPETHRVRVGRDDVFAGLGLACSRRSVDLLRLYIERLPEWDRQQRLGDWVIRYLGAPDTPYVRATGRAWLVACVERALAPGVLVDVAPVLEGEQQSGKNYAINTLFAGGPLAAPWLCIIGKNFERDENLRLACTRWILHDDEFRTRSPENVDALKSWASRTQETYRVPYAKEITVSPRRGLLIVSTNHKSYLHDSTGNRRWWPWDTGKIDVDGIGRAREQLFAEAFHLLQNGGSWRDTLDAGIYDAVKAETEERRIRDPLVDQIAALIEMGSLTALSTTSIGIALGYRIENIDRKMEMKVGEAMRELGYRSVRPKSDGRRRCYVRVQPEKTTLDPRLDPPNMATS